MHKNLPNCPLLGSEERPNSVIVPWFHLQQTVFMHTNLPNHSLLELVTNWILMSCQPHRVTSGHHSWRGKWDPAKTQFTSNCHVAQFSVSYATDSITTFSMHTVLPTVHYGRGKWNPTITQLIYKSLSCATVSITFFTHADLPNSHNWRWKWNLTIMQLIYISLSHGSLNNNVPHAYKSTQLLTSGQGSEI